MEYILNYLTQVPDVVWQIVAFLLPSNRLFRYLRERIALPPAS